MIVIDPVRTETADLADFHLQVRPGTDLYAVTALAAVLVQEDLIDRAWLAEHADAEGVANVSRVLTAGPDRRLLRHRRPRRRTSSVPLPAASRPRRRWRCWKTSACR